MEKRHLPERREEGRPDVDDEHQAALLIDFDNVTMGIRSNLGQELRNLLNSDVIRGKVAVQRAYADWRRYPQYIVPLSEASIDLIFAPAYGSSKKNATDIRLAIDALELVFVRPEIRTFILMSGDSDFSSLVLKLKEYGKYIIGVGIQESSSDLLVQNCDEYYSYTSLSGLSKAGEGPVERHDPWVLVEKAVARMVKRGDTMRSDRLKQVMLEIDSSFDEKEQGFSKFNRFVVEAGSRGLITIQKMENGQYGVAPSAGSRTEGDEQKRQERKRDADGEDARQGRRGGRRRRGDGEKTRAEASETPSGEAGGTRRARPRLTLESALELLDQVLGQLLEGADDAVRDSDVKRRLLEVHPQFDEGEIGFSKFSKFLQAAEESGAVELSRGPNGNYYVARPSRSRKRAKPEKKKKKKEKDKDKEKDKERDKAQQRGADPGQTVESQDRESTMRKLARFLFGESAEAPPEPRLDAAAKPSLEEGTTEERRQKEGRERRRGRAETGRERVPPVEARRGRPEESRQEERREEGRHHRRRARSEGRPEGREEDAGRRERAAPRGDRREPRAEPEERRSREARGDRSARGRRGGERGRESRPESSAERGKNRDTAAEPSPARVTEREAEASDPAVRERPSAETATPAIRPREEGVARPSDASDEVGRKQVVEEVEGDRESGVVSAPMPGAPRGTIRGRWGSRGRYRPPTEAPPILEGQSNLPGAEQAEPAGFTGTARPDNSVEAGGEAGASAPEPPVGGWREGVTVSANRALVDRLTGYSGIGARTAERLVEAFGEDVIRVIDDEPERVRHILPDHRAELVIQAREEERRLQSPPDGGD